MKTVLMLVFILLFCATGWAKSLSDGRYSSPSRCDLVVIKAEQSLFLLVRTPLGSNGTCNEGFIQLSKESEDMYVSKDKEDGFTTQLKVITDKHFIHIDHRGREYFYSSVTSCGI